MPRLPSSISVKIFSVKIPGRSSWRTQSASLTEDYGLSMKQVAGRLKRSETWCSNLLNLVMLPTPIQASVASGETPVSAALELVKLPGDQQIKVFDTLTEGGEKITAFRVKAK